MHKDILVIDDNSDIRFLICKILKEQNFNVRSAANYDQATLEIKKKLEAGVSDIEGDYKSLNKIFSKHSSKFGGPPGTSTPSSTTYIGKNRDGKKSAANDTKMNFLYDTIISKMPNINIDVSHQDRDVVLASFIDKEKELVQEELKNSGKPDDIAKKISLGKMNKFKEENSLLSQAWVMEPKKKVQDIIKELSIADLKIKEFFRIKIGE